MYYVQHSGFTAEEALDDILADYEYEIAVDEAKEQRAMKKLEIEQQKVLRLKEKLRGRHKKKKHYRYNY